MKRWEVLSAWLVIAAFFIVTGLLAIDYFADRKIAGGTHCEGTTLVTKVIVENYKGTFKYVERKYDDEHPDCEGV